MTLYRIPGRAHRRTRLFRRRARRTHAPRPRAADQAVRDQAATTLHGNESTIAVPDAAATESLHGAGTTLRQDEATEPASPARAAVGRSRRRRGGSGSTPSGTDMPGPGDRIGQYEIIRSLGRGGMGMVCLARDLRLGRLVAIKFLARHGRRMREHFLAEARATARCNHENIVVIHDFGHHRDRPYMVLEHVEGQTLRAWLDARPRLDPVPGNGDTASAPLPPSLAVDLMLPVVRALACAHEMGIVHRDLKPANIMLTGAGVIKVLDFGIAKLMEQARDGTEDWCCLDEAGMVLGTPPYMSPE